MSVRILVGDALAQLRMLPEQSARCCVTSPPYFGLRDYGIAGQMGLEPTPAAYVAGMVAVFAEVRRVLADDGTLWLNLGDSYTGSGKGGNPDPGSSKQATNAGSQTVGSLYGTGKTAREAAVTNVTRRNFDLGPKQLLGIPWRVAFALQEDGWYLRSDIIWSKPNPMPESVTDRPTKAHEYVFLLSKSQRYFYDAAAIRTELKESSEQRLAQNVEEQNGSDRVPGKTKGTMKAVRRSDKQRGHGRRHDGFNDRWDGMTREEQMAGGANARTVWEIATKPFSEAHFATFPPEIPRRCILAGSAKGDLVLDPFGGAGTTGLVADRLGRDAVLIELNPAYAQMAERRIHNDAPLFADVSQSLSRDTP